jgi:UDP-galactopyranose mutase
MPMDVLVIGAGLSGAIVARELASYGKKVLILEKRDHVGGNVYDKKIENINVHCYGPHIFHTDDEKAYSYMNKF